MKIYISPSSQTANEGVGNYGTEAQRMQELSDLLVPKLEAAGHTVYGGDNSLSLSERIADSNKSDVKLHIALHSNGYDGTARGVETWYYSSSSNGKRLSQLIVDEICAIPDAPSNRGAKTKYLAETSNTNAVASLIEVGFHDNTEDAKWIVDNLDEIAQAICDAVEAY